MRTRDRSVNLPADVRSCMIKVWPGYHFTQGQKRVKAVGTLGFGTETGPFPPMDTGGYQGNVKTHPYGDSSNFSHPR